MSRAITNTNIDHYVIVNHCFGKASLSAKAEEVVKQVRNKFSDATYETVMMAVICVLGKEVNGDNKSDLRVVRVPAGATDYILVSNDGYETVYYTKDGEILPATCVNSVDTLSSEMVNYASLISRSYSFYFEA